MAAAHANGHAQGADAPSEDGSESTKGYRRSARLAVMAAAADAGLKAMEVQSINSVKRINEATKRMEVGTETFLKQLDAAAEAGGQKFESISNRVNHGITNGFTKLSEDVDAYKRMTTVWLQTTSAGLRDLSDSWKAVKDSTDVIHNSVQKAADGLKETQSLLTAAFWTMLVSCVLLLVGAWSGSEAGTRSLKPWAPTLVIVGMIGSAFAVGMLAGARRVSAHVRV